MFTGSHIVSTTINERNGIREYSCQEAQQFIGLSNRGKFKIRRESLNVNRITERELRLLLAQHLFLAVGNGLHSIEQFAAIAQNHLVDVCMDKFKIDLDTEFRRRYEKIK